MSKKEFGDFQTPIILSDKVSKFVKTIINEPSIIIEPTCGLGNFIKSNLKIYDSNINYFGFEINKDYINKLTSELKSYKNVTIKNENFFKYNWKDFFIKNENKNILIIGNPLWVNNSDLSTLSSNNIPNKSNFQSLSGLEAKLGKANFDIAEWILIDLIDNIQNYPNATISMLCKTITARKVLKYIWLKGLNINSISLHQIDSKKYFDVSVDACLFVANFNKDKDNEKIATVYNDISFNEKISTFGLYENEIIANIDNYLKYKKFNKADKHYQWRSGIKHDASKVMELTKKGNYFYNGFNEKVNIEEEFIYPLLKSSDISKSNINPRKYVIITQKHVGDDTNKIKENAPKAWKYLTKYSKILNNRKSIIYKKQSKFSIFGIGKYSFSSWKVAISGLYKNINFTVVGMINNKQTMLDDTCYFISCNSKKEAEYISKALNSKIAKEYLESMIFFDSKRPVKVDILKRLNIDELLKYYYHSNKSYNKTLELTSVPIADNSSNYKNSYISDIKISSASTVHL